MLYSWFYGYVVAFAIYVFYWYEIKEILKEEFVGITDRNFLFLISIASTLSWILVVLFIGDIFYRYIKHILGK